MPSELRSSTSLQVVSNGRTEPKVNSLRLETTSPTPSLSSSSPRKRKISTVNEPEATATHPRPLKAFNPKKRARARFPPPPLSMPSASSSSTADYESFDATSPPSPVPTEIIDVEAEDFVRTAQKHGVKVRDYAVDPPLVPPPRARELWMNPFHTLLVHDMHIRRPSERDFWLPGKLLRRLLDIKYVTQKEADTYWTEEDRKLLAEYDERPCGHYPYVIACKRPKPSAAYRVSARKMFYGDPLPGDVLDADIEIPDDGKWEGDEESWQFARVMKQDRERSASSGRRIGTESVLPRNLSDTHSNPTIFPVSSRTPPMHTSSLPETPTYKKQGDVEPFKPSEPSTPTSPPTVATPTTPTSPPPSVPQPSNPRRLGRTKTLAVVSVR